MMRVVASVAAAAALTLSGCTSVRSRTPSPGPRELITQEMIARMNASTAYEVLTRVLNREPSRGVRGGPTSFEQSSPPVVIIDGVRSEVNALRTLPAYDIDEIRILDAREGTLLYGTGAVNGVFVIRTRRG